MNVLIAPDKFKGTLTASEVCAAIEKGLKRSAIPMNVRKFPLADGGEGTLDIFLGHKQGLLIEREVHDPLMRKIKCGYALSGDGKTAFIEIARASGLSLLNEAERDPIKTTTFGTGELIRDALDRGVDQIILAIGGSSTNDAALGAAVALGARIFDKDGNILFPRGGTLQSIDRIDLRLLHPRLAEVEVTAICDVSNPFYGEHGAAVVYAPQKGATREAVAELDKGLQTVADVVLHQYGIDLQKISGAGAGGGFAGGCHVCFQAELKSGVQAIFELTNFLQALRWADVVITGEGKLDSQTLQGKLVNGVAGRASALGKKVLVVCGQNDLTSDELKQLNIHAHFSLSGYAGLSEALHNPARVLEALTRTEIAACLQKIRGGN